MKRISLCVIALSLLSNVRASTTFYLRTSTDNVVIGSDDLVARVLSETKGTSAASFTKNTLNGPVGTLGTEDQFTIAPIAGQLFSFVTPPLNPVTISGNVKFNFWASETASTANATLTAELLLVSASGTILSTIVSAQRANPELSTTFALAAWSKGSIVTAIAKGQRLAVRLYVDDAVGVTQTSGKMVSLRLNGNLGGVSGDSWVEIGQSISYATLSPTVSPTVSATPTISATFSATPTESVTHTFTATPSATRTQTFTRSATHTASATNTAFLTNTPVLLRFQPVSSSGPQTVTTPLPGHVLEIHRLAFRKGPSQSFAEFFGGPATNISDPAGWPIDAAWDANTTDVNVMGTGTTYPRLGLGHPLIVREPTPIGPAAVGGVTYPFVIVQYSDIFVGTATATPTATMTATPTFTP